MGSSHPMKRRHTDPLEWLARLPIPGLARCRIPDDLDAVTHVGWEDPGGSDVPALDLTGDPAAGASIFASAGCGGCHTLSASDSSGSFSYGVGVSWIVSPRVAFDLEYQPIVAEGSDWSSSSLNLGFRFRF